MFRKLVIISACFFTTLAYSQKKERIKYVFYFIGDGMGITQVAATDLYLKTINPESNGLFFKKIPFVSLLSTNAYNHPITCSAAAGTALATGNKTSLGTIGMNYNHTTSFQTIAEYARDNSYKVGIISSVYVNHATPASFYAKVGGRNEYYDIGIQLVKSQFDFFGGGVITESEPKDSLHESVYCEAEYNGYKIVRTKAEFDSLKRSNQHVIVGSQELNGEDNIANLIDRNNPTKSLADYVKKGIEVMQNDTGFFMMCEGGKIDWACHANDIASMVGEVIDFDNAIKVAYNFYERYPEETLILITSDHETGGMAMGNSFTGYEVNPLAISYQKISSDRFGNIINSLHNTTNVVSFSTVLDSVKKYYSLGDKIVLNDYDSARLIKAFRTSIIREPLKNLEHKMLYGKYEPISVTCSKILAEKAGFGWTTFDHTGTPVALRAIGLKSNKFFELTDNTQIAKKLFKFIRKP